MKLWRIRLVALIAGLGLSVGANAFPDGPVRIVVPYPPGGGVDTLARAFADRLGKAWEQPVVVDNRPGAATIIGTNHVAKAKPDGLTLLFTSDSAITSNPHLYAELPFDPLQELEPVTQAVAVPLVVVAHPGLKAQSMQDLVALAKARPGELNYASFGDGSQPNLMFETLRVNSGAELTQIPYKGIAPAQLATLSGETQLTLGGALWVDYFNTGKLVPLAIDRSERLPQLPDVPTLAEAGFPELQLNSWFGFFVPAGTPPERVTQLQAAIAEVLEQADFREKEIQSFGLSPVGSTPEAFKTFVQEDYRHKQTMIEQAGIKKLQ